MEVDSTTMTVMPLFCEDYQRVVRRAHDRLSDDPTPAVSGVRSTVLESWNRSLASHPDPGRVDVRVAFDDEGLDQARHRHPFHALMPVLESHLIRPATQAGMLVALGDAAGRLLWVEGDRPVRNRAEAMGFVPGTDWSEEVMGTSAPGLAVLSGAPVQISGAEHFAADVHPWSCSAVPLIHPLTDEVLGIIDVTGGEEAVSSLVLPLLRSTAEAARSLLLRGPTPPSATSAALSLQLTGSVPTAVDGVGRQHELSLRHAEILLVLSEARHGLSTAALAEAVWPYGAGEVTVRAEVARLRKKLTGMAGARVRVASRPYCLHGELDTDVHRVRRSLNRDDLEHALEAYRGQVLRESESPGVREIGYEISMLLRSALLRGGTWRQLWDYANLPEARDDGEVLAAVRGRAPADSVAYETAVIRTAAL